MVYYIHSSCIIGQCNPLRSTCCSYQVVESMRQGKDPEHAAIDAMARIARKYPKFVGAVFAVNRNGTHAGACHGWTFQYTVKSVGMHDLEVFTVRPSGDYKFFKEKKIMCLY